MSASKIIRNSGGDRTVTYGGRDWAFPGNGDTTMVPGDVADHVEQFHARDGLLIVHPEAEAAERAAALRLVASDTADGPTAAEIFEASKAEAPVDEPKTEGEAQPDPPAPVDPPEPVAPPKKPAKKAAKKKG